MSLQYLRRFIAVVLIAGPLGGVAASGTSPASGAGVSRQDANTLKRKVDAIVAFGQTPPPRQPRRTTLTEAELNAYLALDATPDLPTGVVEPSLSMLGPGRLAGRAVVDLDAVRRGQPPQGLLDPRRLLVGRLPVTASGVLQTANGIARFSLDSAAVGGIPLPKVVLQEILSYYTRSGNKPGGLSMDDPFVLPSNIREIQVDRGRAIVVQ